MHDGVEQWILELAQDLVRNGESEISTAKWLVDNGIPLGTAVTAYRLTRREVQPIVDCTIVKVVEELINEGGLSIPIREFLRSCNVKPVVADLAVQMAVNRT